MGIMVVTGTGTEVGKTVGTAALAAAALGAGRSVAVLKAAQTGVGPGEPGDVDEVIRLVGGDVTGAELVRYPEPLSPAAAARRSGLAPVEVQEVARAAEKLAAEHDLVLVEGAGGLLVHFDAAGATLADVAGELAAPVLVVASAGLGTLNIAALTAEALRARGLEQLGVVIGSWPREPGLADRCNVHDLPVVAGAPLLGAIPEGVAALPADAFRAAAAGWLSPVVNGTWDAARFAGEQGPPPRG